MMDEFATILAVALNLTSANVPPDTLKLAASYEQSNNCVEKVIIHKEGGYTVTQCGKTISIGGPIKDVSWATPLGGENALLPKLGRDIEAVGHWLGDRFGIHIRFGGGGGEPQTFHAVPASMRY